MAAPACETVPTLHQRSKKDHPSAASGEKQGIMTETWEASRHEDTPYNTSDNSSSDADSAHNSSGDESLNNDHPRRVRAASPRRRVSRHSSSNKVSPVSPPPASTRQALRDTMDFYRTLWYYYRGGKFGECPYLADSPQAVVQVYSLYLVLWMWDRDHYRAGSFQDDMLKNLRNVAIPGTGIPLILLVRFKIIAILFLLIGYPIVCLIAGLYKGGRAHGASCYSEQLLRPQDWFSFWRLNCVLASYHADMTKAKGFDQEDKWTFLTSAADADIPVSPWLDAKQLVIKDKNEEGGMGIHFYSNATHGGRWIIQERLNNDAFVSALLPEAAPLSTLRVITSSVGGLRESCLPEGSREGALPGTPCSDDIKTLSCVFRAGRKGADTDHSCILFDVDTSTGEIRKGTTNAHWYQLGADKVLTTKWLNLEHTIESHPDCGSQVTGHVIPNMSGIKALCESAHLKLLPDVPMCGWDVALTEEAGMCLLEVNLSCNFFKGSFDQAAYFEFVQQYFKFHGRKN